MWGVWVCVGVRERGLRRAFDMLRCLYHLHSDLLPFVVGLVSKPTQEARGGRDHVRLYPNDHVDMPPCLQVALAPPLPKIVS